MMPRKQSGWKFAERNESWPQGWLFLWRKVLFLAGLCYTGRNGDVAHLVERGIRIAEVVGSSPIVSTIRLAIMGHFGFSEPRSSKDALCLLEIQIAAILASSLASCRDSSVVEHFHGKEGVSGSNPDRGSIKNDYFYIIFHHTFMV